MKPMDGISALASLYAGYGASLYGALSSSSGSSVPATSDASAGAGAQSIGDAASLELSTLQLQSQMVSTLFGTPSVGSLLDVKV